MGDHRPTWPSIFNWWVLNIALPAMVLEIIPRLQFNRSLWFLPASMWLMFLSAWLVFHYLGTRMQWSRQRIGGLILITGLSNSSFVGFPLIEALRGKQAYSMPRSPISWGAFSRLRSAAASLPQSIRQQNRSALNCTQGVAVSTLHCVADCECG